MKFWSHIYSIYLYILLICESEISILDRNSYRRHQKKSACEFRVQAEACAGRMSDINFYFLFKSIIFDMFSYVLKIPNLIASFGARKSLKKLKE